MRKDKLKSLIKSIIREVRDSKDSTEPCIGGSYAGQQTSVDGSNVRPERDPLNDPEMKTETFHFDDFNWLSNGAGFDTPSDVYWDSTYIGTIESSSDGNYYQIVFIDTPQGKKRIAPDKQNQFKSKNLAAETLHKVWKMARKEGLFNT